MSIGRRAVRRALLTGLVAITLAAPAAIARDEKTVFHGLPIEPESPIRPGRASHPIALQPAWTFDGFAAPIAGDPAADAHLLVATDVSGRMAALDPADGRLLWSARLGAPADRGPALVGGAVLQGTTAGDLHAFDATDGSPLWVARLGGAPIAPPLPVAGRLLVATAAPALLAIDPGTGSIAHRLPLPGRPVAPASGEGIVAIGTDHGMLLALSPETLQVRWRRYLREAVTAPPLVRGHRIFVTVADRSVRALRTRNGHERWRQRLGSIATARPLAANGYLYVLGWDDDVYIFRARNGHLLGRVRLDHRLNQDAALGGEHLFVTPFTEASVVGLSLPGLAVAGHYDLEEPGEWFTSGPVLAGDRVAVAWGRDAGRILALRLSDAPPADKASVPAPGAKTDAGTVPRPAP